MMETGFLNTGIKNQCLGCEACTQVCAHAALAMEEDTDGFRYPKLNPEACVEYGLCHKVCPDEENIDKYQEGQNAFGGYARDERVRCLSTSGGAFSCIVDAWCERRNYVIFGAVSTGLEVYHDYITDKADIGAFRKSKYSQSKIGDSYKEVRRFLKEGKNVLFSGTPCQVAGLRKFLKIGKNDLTRLLTVEVVCEGVPSPLYVRKLDQYLHTRHQSNIESLDYRYKDSLYDVGGRKMLTGKGRWDFEVMEIILGNGKRLKKDRWFNPFWSIWLNHLMNRPSCYRCPYTTKHRVADITLGDLWGVHLYCPELYGENGGSSLMISNTSKGHEIAQRAASFMEGHILSMEDALMYQSPMRRNIPMNPQRDEFMGDLTNPTISYKQLTEKWAKKPSLKLLFSKYVWGNRQKVRVWNLKRKFAGK